MIIEQPIETQRLILREFIEEDFAAIREYAGDPEVTRYVRFGPTTEDDTKAFLQKTIAEQKSDSRKSYDFSVILKSSHRLIGAAGLHLQEKETGDIGYTFIRSFWGNGYATESAGALLTFGFEQLNLHRITATCDIRNAASYRIMEKLKMRREAHFHQDVWQRDHWRDSYLYAILKEEWKM